MKSETEKKKYSEKVKISSFLFVTVIVGATFLFWENLNLKNYVAKNKEAIQIGEKYKEEKERESKGFLIHDIDEISNEKKNLMLNLIPSGSPLTKEISVILPFKEGQDSKEEEQKGHSGVDLKGEIGEDVVSTAAGIVTFSGTMEEYGNVIVVDHLFGLKTFYGHLNKLNVEVGKIIDRREKIGEVGISGKTTVSHLHYEVRFRDKSLEPQNFIDWNKENFKLLFEKENNVNWNDFLKIVNF